jgi:acyl carrier protein
VDTSQIIREYIQKEIANGREISNDESLLDAGVLDSLAIVKLLAYVEDEFDVEIPDSDFDPDNFESVATITQLIERIRG